MAGDIQKSIQVHLDLSHLDADLAELRSRLERFSQENASILTFSPKFAGGSPTLQAPPTFLGHANPHVPPTMPPPPRQTTGGFFERMTSMMQQYQNTARVPPAPAQAGQNMADIRYRQALDIALRSISTPETQANRDLTRAQIDLIQQVNRLSGRATTIYRGVQGGTPVNRLRTSQMLETLTSLQEQLSAEFEKYTSSPRRSASTVLQQSQSLTSQLQAAQATGDKDAVRQLTQALRLNIGQARGAEDMGYALSQSGAAQQNLERLLALSPPGSGTRTALGNAGNIAKTVLPVFGALFTAGVFGKSMSFGMDLAQQAGAIGMQAGGANPNRVWNWALSAGANNGFSATQLSQAAQLQGQFSGTGSVAFLFRDAMQTAEFARYVGVGTNTAAQILGTYQQGGAFRSGQEAGTAQAITAALGVSGANSQVFMAGLNSLLQNSVRLSPLSGTNGPAQSLALISALGNATGMSLFGPAQAATTLQTMSQGFMAGPGQGSGLTAQLLMPVYQAAMKTMAPGLNKALIGASPLTRYATMLSTPLFDNEKETAAVLRAVHRELASAGNGTLGSMEQLGFSQFLFGNTSATSQIATSQIAGPGFAKYLDAFSKTVMAAHPTHTLTEAQRQTKILSSISGNTYNIYKDLERVLGAGAGALLPAGSGIGGILGAAPGLTFGVAGAFGVSSMFSGLLGGIFGGGMAGGGGIAGGIAALGDAAASAAGALAALVPILAPVLVAGGATAIAAATIPSSYSQTRKTGVLDVNNGWLGDWGALAGGLVNLFAGTSGSTGMGTWTSTIQRAAKSSGLPASLIAGVIHTETGGVLGSRGDIMGWTGTPNNANGTYNPRSNIVQGSQDLASLIAQYGGNIPEALAVYNRGPNWVAKHGWQADSAYYDAVLGYARAVVAPPTHASTPKERPSARHNAHRKSTKHAQESKPKQSLHQTMVRKYLAGL